MANRVIMDFNRLKISKPGFDVYSSGPADTIFNSDYGGVHFMSAGQVYVPPTPNNFDTNRYFDIYYSKVIRPFNLMWFSSGTPQSIFSFGAMYYEIIFQNGSWMSDAYSKGYCWVSAMDLSKINSNNAADYMGYNYYADGILPIYGTTRWSPRGDRNHVRLWYSNPRGVGYTMNYRICDIPV